MPDISRILFAQKAAVMAQHRDLLRVRGLGKQLEATVEFASAPEDIEPGSSFDVVIAPTVPWLPELLARTNGVQWIHFLSAGIDKIWQMDVDWAAFTLTSSKGIHAIPISEYVLGAMLHFAKRFDQFTEQSQQAVWQREWLSELTEAEVVVVGAGQIGRAITDRGRFLGMRVRVIARSARHDSELGEVLGFETLLDEIRSADYLVVAAPLTPETTGLIGERVLAALKPGAVLIDVSRGGVVSTADVLRALDAGTLRGAALDVFEDEPLPADSPLWKRTDVLVTPHVAGTTPHYMERALDIFLDNAQRFVLDESLATPVDPKRRY